MLPLLARHIRALADRDPLELDDISHRFEEAGMLLLGAEAAAQAWRHHRRNQQPGRARMSKARAAALAKQCEGARTPALGELDTPDVLTAREREIATLAVTGLSNRQIAGQLSLSARTVDNVLHRLYAKLAIPGRAALGTVLRHD
ncbi:MAG: LuxR C-terminal-related transcriptional regulator [Acidimicrobiales bacterium]